MRWALLPLILPGLAWGSVTLSDEVTLATTARTAQNPRSGYLSNRLSGSYGPTQDWEVRGDVLFTFERPTPPQADGAFRETGNRIFLFSAGLDYFPSDRLYLGAELSLSPRSTQRQATTVTWEDAAAEGVAGEALLKSTSSSSGILLGGGWQSGGFSPESTALDLALSFTHYDTVQTLEALETLQPQGCGGLSGPMASPLNQLVLGVNVGQTLRDHTDLTLGGSLYLYDRDPVEVGYFSIATLGRTLWMGNGVPVAPLRFSLRTSAARRFFDGALTTTLFGSYGRYVSGLGTTGSLGMRAQLRFSRPVRAWASAALHDEADPLGGHLLSTSVSLGVRYSF